MKPVERSELLSLGSYEGIRDRFRARMLEQKRARYVSIGENMTALFENHDSALFQIQEMLRTERITQEKAILHELETYNELVPGDHELSATIFVEYPEREQRERMLRELVGLETSFFFEVRGERAELVPDRRGTDPTRTMAVHYVKFVLPKESERVLRSGEGPAVLGVDHPAYRARAELPRPTLLSLRDDF
ncbi:MAG TPA: DUF3501 family protein [Polyangiaceae bacterium]|nr:DUF3501 family protein [Polyangiaceae bacterium]